MPAILRKTNNSTIQLQSDDVLEFIMSDSSEDRHGDTINPHGWDIKEFLQNPIALLNHNADYVVGRWANVRVEKGALRGHLQMAPPGTSTRLDEFRKLVLSGIYRACSVGFQELDASPRPNGGKHYKRQRLLECSVVSVPSNPSALRTEARLLGISETTIKALIDKPPVNASFSQRADFARRSTMKKHESTDAVMRRINAKVRTAMAKKRSADEDRAHRDALKILALGDDHEAIEMLLVQEAFDDLERQKRRDAQLSLRDQRNAKRLAADFALRKKQGATDEELMKQYFARLNRRG